LFKSYCTSIYGAELWALDSANIMRPFVLHGVKLSGVYYNYHFYFLPSLSDTLPVYDEICKRSMKLIATTLVLSNMLVQSIANYCVMFGRYSSFIGTNALLCCDRYNWSLSELISNPEHIKYFSFKCWHFNGLFDIQKSTAGSLSDFIAIRDGQLCLPPLFFSSQ